MNDSFDLKKSIEKGKLIFNISSLEKFGQYMFSYFLVIILPIIFFDDLNKHYIENTISENIQWIIKYFLFSFSVSGFLLYRVLSITKLKRYHGEKDKNRELVRDFIESNNLNKSKDNKNYIVAHEGVSAFAWGRRFTFIFVNEDILFNLISFGLHETKLPIFLLSDIGYKILFKWHIEKFLKDNESK